MINSFRMTSPVIVLLFCLLLSGCVTAPPPKAEPTPTPEHQVINALDIVERADELCKKQGDCRQALILYTQALKERGESTELFKKRGMAHYSLKEIELAIADFSKAIDLQKEGEEKDAELFFIRGLSRSVLQKEDRAGACSDFKMASKLDWRPSDKEFDQWYVEYCPTTK